MDVDDRSVHTNTIEGANSHIKRWLNTIGGTRDGDLADCCAEYEFHRNYIMDKAQAPLRMWKMLRAIAKHGIEAKILVDTRNIA